MKTILIFLLLSSAAFAQNKSIQYVPYVIGVGLGQNTTYKASDAKVDSVWNYVNAHGTIAGSYVYSARKFYGFVSQAFWTDPNGDRSGSFAIAPENPSGHVLSDSGFYVSVIPPLSSADSGKFLQNKASGGVSWQTAGGGGTADNIWQSSPYQKSMGFDLSLNSAGYSSLNSSNITAIQNLTAFRMPFAGVIDSIVAGVDTTAADEFDTICIIKNAAMTSTEVILGGTASPQHGVSTNAVTFARNDYIWIRAQYGAAGDVVATYAIWFVYWHRTS